MRCFRSGLQGHFMHHFPRALRVILPSRRTLSAVRHLAFGGTAILCCALFGGASHCLGQVLSSESDTPVEECELSQHLAICLPQSLKRRDASPGVPLRIVTRRGHPSSNAAIAVRPAVRGHRLSNGLLAPLRC